MPAGPSIRMTEFGDFDNRKDQTFSMISLRLASGRNSFARFGLSSFQREAVYKFRDSPSQLRKRGYAGKDEIHRASDPPKIILV